MKTSATWSWRLSIIVASASLASAWAGCAESPDEAGARAAPTAVDRTAAEPAPAPPIPVTPAAELPKLGPSFYGLELDLEDQSGRRVTTESLDAGGPVIVSMFYATCTYACPTLIRDVVAIEQRLSPEARKKVRVLLVTFDPEHDTPEVMARLVAAHGVDGARWSLARARGEEATRELAAALGITYRRLPDGNYNHASLLFALDGEGVPRAKIDGLKQDASGFIAALEGLSRSQ